MLKQNESMTAKICSFARANHSICSGNKIFDDFLAFALMGDKEYKKTEKIIEKSFSSSNPQDFLNEYFCPVVLPRIAYAESRLCRFLSIYKNIQYVILGAGMDTFSLRNKNKNIDVFELDHPLTQKYKLNRIEKAGFKIPTNTYFVPIDFEIENTKDVLYASGFDFNKPSFFSFLGVTYYLDLKSFENTIASISEVSHNTAEFVFDFPDKTKFRNTKAKLLADITASMGEPMKEGLEYSDIENLFKKYEFKIENHLTPFDIQKTYLENEDNLRVYEHIHFITAIKENGNDKF